MIKVEVNDRIVVTDVFTDYFMKDGKSIERKGIQLMTFNGEIMFELYDDNTWELFTEED
jgi:hypothetical protein